MFSIIIKTISGRLKQVPHKITYRQETSSTMAGSSSRDLKSAAILPWESICYHVNKAVVFLDGPATECLHWVGGMQMLLKAGAVNVKEFSSFEVCVKLLFMSD